MDGSRLREFWNQEVRALLSVHKQFETLLPNKETRGADHHGEDGRYVEALIRSYLRKYLPRDLEVLTGFILRPAVKTGGNVKHRKGDIDRHSTQLDIIVYDTANFPVFQRIEETVIVPPEGVIAVISVKKTLRKVDIQTEYAALKTVSEVCRSDDPNVKNRRRGPFLGLVGATSDIPDKKVPREETVFSSLLSLFGSPIAFDDLIGFIGDLSSWHIIKARPTDDDPSCAGKAKYLYFKLKDEDLHQGFQQLLSGILSVYYDASRNSFARPGYTAFPQKPAKPLGEIPYDCLR